MITEVHIIDYILKKTSIKQNAYINKYKNHNKVNPNIKHADRRVRYCKIGKHTWEYKKINNKNGDIIKYNEIPSYGKKVKNCIDCNKD